MTTELEKQFFDTFGIVPKYQDTCTVEEKYWNNEELANEYGTFDQYMNAKCGNQENCTTQCSCAYQKEIYPQITDRQYLGLLAILNKKSSFIATTIDELKEEALNDSIVYHLSIKEEVRALFEEKK